MWKFLPHQIEGGKVAMSTLLPYHIHYLAWKERTNKSGTALYATENLSYKNILIITTKKALDGWKEHLDNLPLTKNYTLTNYHQLGTSKIVKQGSKKFRETNLKLDRDKYDCVIIDEAHNYISSFPKPTSMWYVVKTVCANKDIIYLSATPNAQSKSQLFHQFAVSSYSPFKEYANFYKFHAINGVEDLVRIGRDFRESYKKLKPETMDRVSHLFSFKTLTDVGINILPEPKLHYIELSAMTKDYYNKLQKDKVMRFNGLEFVADSIMKERTMLHQIEGGTILETKVELVNDVPKVKRIGHLMFNAEKIDYILDTWGDTDDMVIMYHFKTEKFKLEKYFGQATLLQASSFAEGVDLHHYEHLIVYSQDYSTAKHSQRMARQANAKRTTPITVHYLLVKNAISEQAYKTVAENKTNFVDKMYVRRAL